jgi:hypothetical protein
MDVLTLYVGNDMILEVEGLTDEASGEFVNDADVTATLYTLTGAPVPGQVWPIAMPHLADSNGIYRATMADSLDLTPNQRYRARLIADGGPGRRSQWDIDVVAKIRKR